MAYVLPGLALIWLVAIAMSGWMIFKPPPGPPETFSSRPAEKPSRNAGSKRRTG